MGRPYALRAQSVGCLLFLWIPVVETYGIGAESKRFELTKVPNLVGGTLFLAGIYLAYFELINMDSEGIDAGHYNFLWCPWRTLERLGIHYASWLGALGYLLGTQGGQLRGRGGSTAGPPGVSLRSGANHQVCCDGQLQPITEDMSEDARKEPNAM